jgi:hypothetical protein
MTNSRNQPQIDDEMAAGPRYTANEELLKIEQEMKEERRKNGHGDDDLKRRNWSKHISKHPEFPEFAANDVEEDTDE